MSTQTEPRTSTSAPSSEPPPRDARPSVLARIVSYGRAAGQRRAQRTTTRHRMATGAGRYGDRPQLQYELLVRSISMMSR
ncbi:MAG: hypothetical protein JWM93_3544 [Frankiales bacterium]|nr:hypothetical protein [Frankiales bacterium]